LTVRLARENRRWEAARIQGELRRPGYRLPLSARSCALIASRHQRTATNPGVLSCAPTPPRCWPPVHSPDPGPGRKVHRRFRRRVRLDRNQRAAHRAAGSADERLRGTLRAHRPRRVH
jgi:hypothetical protein